MTGVAVNSFEIPPEPGLPQQFMMRRRANYPSSEVKENGLEQNYYGILPLQGAIGDRINYQVASAFHGTTSSSTVPTRSAISFTTASAAKILHTGFINGVQEDTSYKLNSQHQSAHALHHSIRIPPAPPGEQQYLQHVSIRGRRPLQPKPDDRQF